MKLIPSLTRAVPLLTASLPTMAPAGRAQDSADGGLYAELIQNRVFKDDATTPVHWSVVQEGGGAGTVRPLLNRCAATRGPVR